MEFIFALVFLLSLPVMLFGVITVIKPFWLVKTRKHAGLIILGGFILFVLGFNLSPEPSNLQSVEEKEVKKEEGPEEKMPEKGDPKEEKSKEDKPEPPKDKPEISEHAKEMTIDFITDDPLVKDAHIEVKGDKVTIAIIVNAAMNEERAKEVGDNSVRFLNTMVDGTEPATKHYLGSLWDHYDLHVGVGTGPDHFIAQGAKVKGAPRIVW